MDKCVFCCGSHVANEYDEPFYARYGYKALSSVGAINEGWVLIIPDEHCASSKKYFSVSSYLDFVKTVKIGVQEEYGECVVFEHGPKSAGSLTGCGVDHAHLHIVPVNFYDFEEAVGKAGKEWKKIRLDDVEAYVRENEYLMYSNSEDWDSGLVNIHILPESESQFFRKVVALISGASEFYDYKKYKFTDNAINTKRRLHKLFHSCCEVA